MNTVTTNPSFRSNLNGSLTRRAMLRGLAGGAATLAAATVLGPREAAAGRLWCQADPEFLINGRRLHVYILGEETLHDLATGPSRVTLHVPREGVEAEFVWADDGFGGLGYDVRIELVDWLDVGPNDAIQFAIEAVVPAADDLPVIVEAVHEHQNGKKTQIDRQRGRTNQTVNVSGRL